MPEVRPRPGDLLGGKYRIEREIGSGGMGVVYEVTHLVMTERRFAVKWLLPLNDGGEAARRFVREARIAGSIRHPNVVDVYDINIGEDGCFMVMELLEGESLDARLRRVGCLGGGEACRILLSCLPGVAAAHAAGVIHRDLKPGNIFLCRTPDPQSSYPKVLDFGISRALPAAGSSSESTETRKGTLIGTPAYMAPEQLRGAACDVRTDVYALGITLYEMLSGQRAYDAPTYADLIVRVVSGDAEPLDSLVPDLPPGLCRAVMRAMHRDPAQRFASVAELAESLAAFAHTSGVSTLPASLPMPHVPSHSQPSAAARRGLLLAAAAVGLALAFGIWSLGARTSEEHRVHPAPATAQERVPVDSSAHSATDPAPPSFIAPAPQPAAAAQEPPASPPKLAEPRPKKRATKRNDTPAPPQVEAAPLTSPTQPGKPKPLPPLTEL